MGKYIIKAGDKSLYDMEKRGGMPIGILTKLNPDLTPNQIHIGREINWPDEVPTNGTEAPENISLAKLDVLVMPNGEILCSGNRVGWCSQIGKYLSDMWPAA